MQSRDTFVTSLSSGDDNETLLDTIGQIEALNLTIDLPKVIVVGDEKSGKSSVMEALSGYPFPIDEDVCTTFPTEIVLTREPKSEGTTYKACIITKSKRWMSSLNNLGDFENGFSFEYGELSNVFQQAAHVLGVTIDGSERRFTDDTLRIEICGPNNPRLTLVDLPGIYQVGDRGNENGRDIVKSILRTYFEHDLSLVLLVWSATTWYHTSHAISVLENHTKVLNRTIGVMTHLDSDSVKQKKVLNIANNKELKLPMGWHSLVNLSQKDRKDGKTLSDRDDKEKIHFATNWKEINLRDKGIAALNTKLEQRVLETTQSHLTSLVASVKNALQMREKILESIGYERTTTEKRRNYLRNIAGEFKSLVESATYGYYLMNSEHASFYLDQNANVIPQRHLLARVRAMNQMFSIAMRYRGKANTLLDKGANDINEFMERTYQRKMYEAQIDGENPTTDSKGASEPTSPTSPEEQLLHDHVKELNIPQDVALPYIQHVESRFTRRDEYEEQTKKCQRTQLGPEQPGEISSQILSQLLRKETLPWAGVANIHFAQVWRAAEIFVDEALDQCASGTVRAHIESTITSPKLKELKNQLDKRRNELLESHMIWNTGVTDSFVNLRMVEKRSKILTMRKIGRGVPEEDSNSSLQNFLLQKLLPRLVDCIKPDVSSRLGGPALVKTMEGIFREVSNDSTTLQIEDRTSDYDQFPLMGPYPPYHSNWSAASAVDHNETYYESCLVNFVGCINTQIVAQGLLNGLRAEIFTPDIVDMATDATIDHITRLDEATAMERVKCERELSELRIIVERLEVYQSTTTMSI